MISDMLLAADAASTAAGNAASSMIDSSLNTLGVNLFEESIDQVIFSTNQFITSATFIGNGGPFWWILQMCMGLGALFSIIVAASMAYKMMLKGETFDPLKILRVISIAMVMFFWYPSTNLFSSDGCILDLLSYIPNCIGSYTHSLYEIEATQVADKFKTMTDLMQRKDNAVEAEITHLQGLVSEAKENSKNGIATVDIKNGTTYKDQDVEGGLSAVDQIQNEIDLMEKAKYKTSIAGFNIGLDKLLVFLAVLLYRIGWWSTIYIQQIILGMLTIFGPLQWAFSVLPKWEGAWAKWLIRYLTVQFYGAMLYFVGFYVLLLFDIVLSIQINDLNAIISTSGGAAAYLKSGFFTAGYLVVAAVVAVKCLNLVPDLAAWMIPEGEATFSTRNFGEGVSTQVNTTARGIVQPATGILK